MDPTWFETDKRRSQLRRLKALGQVQLDHDSEGQPSQEIEFDERELADGEDGPEPDDKFGTVGAVALDRAGNIVAGTSTGGMTNKQFGRLGDSPVIGSGTYADNKTCGVSSTGHGEFYLRATVARDIAAMMEYKGLSLAEAAQAALDKVASLGGSGGVICLDGQGNVAMPFNTTGMSRGFVKEGEALHTAMYICS